MWQDLANGSFELFAAPFIAFSIVKLYKDKVVRGISWVHIFFFTIWGLWNLYYYPHLNQWWSFIGGISIAIINTIYFIMLINYTIKGRRNAKDMS